MISHATVILVHVCTAVADTNQPTNKPINQPNKQTNQPTNKPPPTKQTNKPTNQPTNKDESNYLYPDFTSFIRNTFRYF